MKIEDGKYYQTRDGQVVGPMNVPPKLDHWSKAVISDCAVEGDVEGWFECGKYRKNESHDLDLIAEWADAPARLMIPLPDMATFLDNDHDKVCVKCGDGGVVIYIFRPEKEMIAHFAPTAARNFAAAIIAYADAIDARPKD